MAKIKALPKAIIVALVVGALGFGVYKLLPPPKPATTVEVAQDPDASPEQQKILRDREIAQTRIDYERSLTPPPPRVGETPDVAVGEPAPTGGKLPGAGIASGAKTGTNYPMVNDIIKVCSREDYPLRNVISTGSIDNISKIYTDPNSQFGIVQEDALALQQRSDPKMMSRIVAVFPFFSVEIHAVVSKNSPIKSLADMEGKRVSEGPVGSGTSATLTLVKELTGIKWHTDPNHLTQAEAIKAVNTGLVDVAFIVAGQPIQVLTAQAAPNLRLVSIQHEKLDSYKFYTKTQLPTGAYPWQGTPVTTYKVNNVLATFAYKNQYQKEISDLVSCITKNVDKLQGEGHPKWRDVDPLDIDRVKWPVHPAALSTIKREAKRK